MSTLSITFLLMMSSVFNSFSSCAVEPTSTICSKYPEKGSIIRKKFNSAIGSLWHYAVYLDKGIIVEVIGNEFDSKGKIQLAGLANLDEFKVMHTPPKSSDQAAPQNAPPMASHHFYRSKIKN